MKKVRRRRSSSSSNNRRTLFLENRMFRLFGALLLPSLVGHSFIREQISYIRQRPDELRATKGDLYFFNSPYVSYVFGEFFNRIYSPPYKTGNNGRILDFKVSKEVF